MDAKSILKKVDLGSIMSIIKLLKMLGKSNFGSEPAPQIPPPLLLVGAKFKPGMSSRNLAAQTISKLEQQGVPMTDDIFGGEQNQFAASIYTVSDEIVKEIQNNARFDGALAPGFSTNNRCWWKCWGTNYCARRKHYNNPIRWWCILKNYFMSNYENMTNNEILMSIKKMEVDHFNLKEKMLKEFDKLVNIEKEAEIAAKIISERLKTK